MRSSASGNCDDGERLIEISHTIHANPEIAFENMPRWRCWIRQAAGMAVGAS